MTARPRDEAINHWRVQGNKHCALLSLVVRHQCAVGWAGFFYRKLKVAFDHVRLDQPKHIYSQIVRVANWRAADRLPYTKFLYRNKTLILQKMSCTVQVRVVQTKFETNVVTRPNKTKISFLGSRKKLVMTFNINIIILPLLIQLSDNCCQMFETQIFYKPISNQYEQTLIIIYFNNIFNKICSYFQYFI